jgi:uracil-DNA glycosylase
MIEKEIIERLRQQREESNPKIVFPEGCYGSANAPLVFVGISPGGGSIDTKYSERGESNGSVFWNFEFIEPFEEWSIGFRKSLKPIIENLLQLSLVEGASKLFAFVNFDWIQNPDSSKVPDERINEGKACVSQTLHQINPKIIVALDSKAYQNLINLLKEESYSLSNLKNQRVEVRTASPNSYHRSINVHLIKGNKSLNGVVLLKSLQHPAKIFTEDYALRVAQSLRSAYTAVLGGDELTLSLK